jgi:hypothetical protein
MKNMASPPLHQQSQKKKKGTSAEVPEEVYIITTDTVVEAFDQLCDAFLGITFSGLLTDLSGLAGLVESDKTPPNPWLPKEAQTGDSPSCVRYFRARNLARVACDGAELALSAAGLPDVTGTVRCAYRISEAGQALAGVCAARSAFDDAQHLIPYLDNIIAFKKGEIGMQCGSMVVTLIPWGGFVAVAVRAVGRFVEGRLFRLGALECAQYLHMRAYFELTCQLRWKPALWVVEELLSTVPGLLHIDLETLLLEPKAYLVIADFLAIVP